MKPAWLGDAVPTTMLVAALSGYSSSQIEPGQSSVTDVLDKVTSGQADAGLVYVTDAAGAGDKVTAVKFAEASGVVNTYPIAVLSSAPEADLAQEFVDMVAGEAGQQVLKQAGFGKP